MKISVVGIDGKEKRKLDLDDSVFGLEPNMAVLHQAYVTQRANQRAGTVKTKTRAEVKGSSAKIRRQKYTGRARAGTNRAPTRVGGGLAFGPRPRSYSKDFPKKMRRLAIRSALSGKAADGELIVVDQLKFDAPKTQEIIRILRAVGLERSVLVVTGETDRNIVSSVRNLAKTKALPAAYLNVVDMLNHAGLLMTEDAVRVAEELWGQKAAKKNGAKAEAKAPAKKAAARASRAAPEAEAEPEVAAEAPEEKAEATAAAEAKPKRASRAKRPATETEEKKETKPRARAKKAEPAAEAETKVEAEEPNAEPEAPGREPEASAPEPEVKAEEAETEAPKAEEGDAEAKPKPRRRVPRKKTEDSD